MRKSLIYIYIFCVLVFIVFHHSSVTAQQRQIPDTAQIQVVMSKDRPEYREALEGFKDALNQANVRYNISIELLGNNNFDFRIIDRIMEQKPDLILAVGTNAAINLSTYIKDIPIVVSMVLNPYLNNSTRSNNLAGVYLSIPAEIQFDILKGIIPDIKRLGVLYSPEENLELIREAQKAANKYNIDLISVEVNNEREVPRRLENLIRFVDAIWMVVDYEVTSIESRKYIINEGLKKNIPVIGFAEYTVSAGAALALACSDFKSVGSQAGRMSIRILQGNEQDEFHYEHPENIILYVNERIAKDIGLEIPESIKKLIKVIYK